MLVTYLFWCPYVSLNNGTNIVITTDIITPLIGVLGIIDGLASITTHSLHHRSLLCHLHYSPLCTLEGHSYDQSKYYQAEIVSLHQAK